MATHIFHVPNMNCANCQTTIRQALEENPEVVLVNIELNNKRVSVESDLDSQEIADIITDAGYTPEDYVGRPGLLGRLFGG